MKKEMEEFLVGSYFGFYGENNAEKCIKKAYSDMQRRIPYRFSCSDLEKMKKEGKIEEAKRYNELKNDFKRDITNLIVKETKNKIVPRSIIYKAYFNANDVKYRELFSDENNVEFYYGLAQKWVNMSLKYLWLFGNENIIKEDLDVPLDDFIIRAIRIEPDNENVKYGLGLDCVDEKLKWSTLDNCVVYSNIQKSIKDEVMKRKIFDSAIEWENAAWLEQARINAIHDG